MSTESNTEVPPVLAQVRASDHVARFYEDDGFLLDSVADFVAAGMLAGQSVVIIATEDHREALSVRLEARGLDIDGACFRGRLLFLDAEDALAAFMSDGVPDADLFDATIGAVIEKRIRASGGAGLRAYGEMVDVLWKAGHSTAALALEELWNSLAMRHTFSLLCAYSMGNFYRGSDASDLEKVCRQHSHIIPVETFLQIDSDESRWREIARLQQQARALENEVAERRKIESALRAAIAAQKRTEAELRQTQEELRDFMENAVVGLHWVGPDGRILWANQAELDMLGYSIHEYVGHHVADFHADRDTIDDMLARLMRNEQLKAYPARLRCKDGSIRRVEISSNVLWRDGKFVHTRCFTREAAEP